MKTIVLQTPNVTPNRVIKPTAIILHHTAGSYAGSVNWCMRKESNVSYHCIVDLNGDRTILAKDNQRCFHAGVSSFNGQNDCNSFTLGIAVSGDTTKRQLTKEEIGSVALWCIDKMKLHNIPLERITTHEKVATPKGRKNDISATAEIQIKQRISDILNPQKINYEVKRGDTLFSIANRFKTSTSEIMRLNNLTTTIINIGQKLLIK